MVNFVCEGDSSSNMITITFKLHRDVSGTKIMDKFDDDLCVTFMTCKIRSLSTLFVNTITVQSVSQLLSNFTEVFLAPMSQTSLMMIFLWTLWPRKLGHSQLSFNLWTWQLFKNDHNHLQTSQRYSWHQHFKQVWWWPLWPRKLCQGQLLFTYGRWQ